MVTHYELLKSDLSTWKDILLLHGVATKGTRPLGPSMGFHKAAT